MMQLQIVAPGRAEWRRAAVPEPGDGQILLKVLGVTTCAHWDMHLMDGVEMFPGRPISYPYTPGQPGHEATGVVAAVGSGVDTLSVGMSVAAWRDPGHHVAGCYAQYACLKAENVLGVPARLAPEAIAPLELAMCVQASFDQLARLDAVEGARFCVSGLGPAGLIAVQIARASGARRVIGIDPLLARRELAIRLGADEALPPGFRSPEQERRSGDAFDAAIDCTGLRSSVEFLMNSTREVVAIFGVLREAVSFGFSHWTGLTLMGGPPHNRRSAENALALVLDGRLALAPIVSHVMPFTRYAEGVDLLRAQRATKVCFLPWA
jgi:threonine dehydrogenase-like Zn-dependent dehydrogenase